jgi:hypothetical protein
MSQTPKYDLALVQQLCKSGDLEKIWFSAISRSIVKVIETYSRTCTPKTYEESVRFILYGLQSLQAEDFVQRVSQWGTVADVYGLTFDQRSWYVKFIFEDGVLEQISFHPPEKILTTAAGKILS